VLGLVPSSTSVSLGAGASRPNSSVAPARPVYQVTTALVFGERHELQVHRYDGSRAPAPNEGVGTIGVDGRAEQRGRRHQRAPRQRLAPGQRAATGHARLMAKAGDAQLTGRWPMVDDAALAGLNEVPPGGEGLRGPRRP